MGTITSELKKIESNRVKYAQSKEESHANSCIFAGFNQSNPKVTVCIRKKPIEKNKDTIRIENNEIFVHSNKLSYSLDDVHHCHRFQFDKAYGGESNNIEIFTDSVESMVDHVLNGGCSTIMAYGQTGTGKTHSLLAPHSGIIFESIKYILNAGFNGTISFLEIYLGYVQDCLKNKAKLNIFEKDGKIYASELTSIPFKTFEEAKSIISEGLHNRTTSRTDGNSYSSRSHAALFIDTCKDDRTRVSEGSRLLAIDSTLVFVDLAGSERGTDRKCCSKESAAEGAEINKSLLALKECIRGIEMNSKFLPFRQSKLTQLLKNSFIGESKLFFLATISASCKDFEHTLNTLRYAIRIKESKFFSIEPFEISENCNELMESNNQENINKQIGIVSNTLYKDNSIADETIKIHNLDEIASKMPKDLQCYKNSSENDHSSFILTSDEINRLKDLNLNSSSNSSTYSSVSSHKVKIREIVERILDFSELECDFEKLIKISNDLEIILTKLKIFKAD